MPTPTVSALLNLLGAANSTGGPLASADSAKDGFQSLLDIGTKTDNAPKRQGAPKQDREPRPEILAAPISAPQEPNSSVEETLVEGDETVSLPVKNDHTSAERPDHREPTEQAIIRSEPKKSAPVERVDKETDDTNLVEEIPGSAVHVPKEEAVNVKVASEFAISEDATAVLGNWLDILRQALQALQALGGNSAQTVVSVKVKKIETLSIESSTIASKVELPQADAKANDIKAPDIKNLSGAFLPVNEETAPFSPGQTVKNIEEQLAKLQVILNRATPETAAQHARPAFKALVANLQAFSQFLQERPEAAQEWGDAKEDIIRSARSLWGQVKALIASSLPSDKPPAEGTIATHIKATTEQSPKQPAIFAVETSPTVATPTSAVHTPSVIQSAAAAVVVASGGGSSDARTNSGSQQNNGNQAALTHTLSVGREAAQTQTTQTTISDFSRLLQQARTPVTDQVLLHIKSGMADGSSKIEIKLHPADLGKVEIKLNVDASGKTGVTITADNKNTLDLLQRDARGLERALADAGLKADSGSLSFNLRGEQQEQNQNRQVAQPYTKAPPVETQEIAPAVSRSYVLNLSEGLDIRI